MVFLLPGTLFQGSLVLCAVGRGQQCPQLVLRESRGCSQTRLAFPSGCWLFVGRLFETFVHADLPKAPGDGQAALVWGSPLAPLFC